MSLLAERCQRRLFAIDVRLTARHLSDIGARMIPKNAMLSEEDGGRDRDRTCDPYHVNVVRMVDFLGKSRKKTA